MSVSLPKNILIFTHFAEKACIQPQVRCVLPVLYEALRNVLALDLQARRPHQLGHPRAAFLSGWPGRIARCDIAHTNGSNDAEKAHIWCFCMYSVAWTNKRRSFWVAEYAVCSSPAPINPEEPYCLSALRFKSRSQRTKVVCSDKNQFILDGPDSFANYWANLRRHAPHMFRRHNKGSLNFPERKGFNRKYKCHWSMRTLLWFEI